MGSRYALLIFFRIVVVGILLLKMYFCETKGREKWVNIFLFGETRG